MLHFHLSRPLPAPFWLRPLAFHLAHKLLQPLSSGASVALTPDIQAVTLTCSATPSSFLLTGSLFSVPSDVALSSILLLDHSAEPRRPSVTIEGLGDSSSG